MVTRVHKHESGVPLSWLGPTTLAVMRLMVCGYSIEEIAQLLILDGSTLRGKIWDMQRQLGCRNQAEGRMAMLVWMQKNDPIGMRIWQEKFGA